MADIVDIRDGKPIDERRIAPPLKNGGGGGTSDDMEARLKRLEDDAKEMRGDLKAIRIDLAEIKGKLTAMPSTWQIVGICAGLIGIVIASGGGLLAILKAIAPIAP